MLKRLSILLVFFLLSAGMQAQFSSGRTKKISTSKDTLKLDSLSLVPGSVVLKLTNGEILDSSFYRIVPAKKAVVLNKKKNAGRRDKSRQPQSNLQSISF